MQELRAIGSALMVALISIVLTVGALSISLVEFSPENAPAAPGGAFASPAPVTATASLPPTPEPTIGLESPTPTITLTAASTSTPPGSCQLPIGWTNQITVQAGETLEILAARYRISRDDLRVGNCLVNDSLLPDTKLYVPPYPTNTPAACVAGSPGWTRAYIIKNGDTLYNISGNYYTDVQTLKRVNCKISDFIVAGEMLWVPNVAATRTSNPTVVPGTIITLTPNPTDPITATIAPALPYTATMETLVPAIPLPLTSTPIPTPTGTGP